MDPDILSNMLKARLLICAARGHTLKVEQLLDRGVDIETRDDQNRTPLRLAIYSHSPPCIKMLLARGANIYATADDPRSIPQLVVDYATTGTVDAFRDWLVQNGESLPASQTPRSTENDERLAHAVESRKTADVAALLDRGFDFETPTIPRQLRAIHLAAGEGDEETLRLLVNRGARIDCVGDGGWRPIHYAASRGHLPVVNFLLDMGADASRPLKDGTSIPKLARQHNFPEIAQVVEEWIGSPFSAASAGDVDTVYQHLSLGFDPDNTSADGGCAIHLSATAGHVVITRLLLECGASLDAVDKRAATPLMLAAAGGHDDVIRELLMGGASIEASDGQRTALHHASTYGHVSAIKLLLSRGARIEDGINSSGTPLHVACVNGEVNAAAALLDSHANVNARDRNGQTALDLATYFGKLDVVKVLISRGANVNTRLNSGESALHRAADRGQTEIARALIEKGAMVNSRLGRAPESWQEYMGETPLQFAAYQGHAEVLKLLLSRNADAHVRDTKNRTALDIARLRKHQPVVDILQRLPTAVQSAAS